MRKLIFVFAILAAAILAGCDAASDVMGPVSQQQEKAKTAVSMTNVSGLSN